MKMKLYIISQEVNTGYDTYDSAVVAAESEEDAKTIHPGGETEPVREIDRHFYEWCGLAHVKVELIGVAVKGTKRGVIVASYKAG